MTSREASYYHVGILVRDLDEAIARFSDTFRCSFAKPFDFAVDAFADPDPRPLTVHATFSQGGPPYVELIQGHPDEGFFRIDLGERLHHIGVWAEDVEAKAAELEAEGGTREASITVDGKVAVWFMAPASHHGTRVELVNAAQQQWLYDLIEGAESSE